RKRNRDPARGVAALNVQHRQAAGALVADVERAHVPSGRDVMWEETDAVMVDDVEGGRIDDVNRAGTAVGHVNARRQLAERPRDGSGKRVGVDVESWIGKAR